MSQTEVGITKEDIINYVDHMEIKKANIGGFDKVDVYHHIQELVKRYGVYMEQELDKQRKTGLEQQRELKALKNEEKRVKDELLMTKKTVRNLESKLAEKKAALIDMEKHKEDASQLRKEVEAKGGEVQKYMQQITTLKSENEKLESYKGSVMGLQNKIAMLETQLEESRQAGGDTEAPHGSLKECIREREALKQDFARQSRVIAELQVQVERKDQVLKTLKEGLTRPPEALEQSLESKPVTERKPYDYAGDIGEILKEARREGLNIIEEARVEAEKEMIKLLNLRVRFKQEQEQYQDWHTQVEAEKGTVETFLKKMAVQYADADQALNSIKEQMADFDVKGIFQSVTYEDDSTESSSSEDRNDEETAC